MSRDVDPYGLHQLAPLPLKFWWGLANGRHWRRWRWEENEGGLCPPSCLLARLLWDGCVSLPKNIALGRLSSPLSGSPLSPQADWSWELPVVTTSGYCITPCWFSQTRCSQRVVQRPPGTLQHFQRLYEVKFVFKMKLICYLAILQIECTIYSFSPLNQTLKIFVKL